MPRSFVPSAKLPLHMATEIAGILLLGLISGGQ